MSFYNTSCVYCSGQNDKFKEHNPLRRACGNRVKQCGERERERERERDRQTEWKTEIREKDKHTDKEGVELLLHTQVRLPNLQLG